MELAHSPRSKPQGRRAQIEEKIAGARVGRKSFVGSTGNQFSRWSIDDVNRHSGSAVMKTTEIVWG